MTQQGKEYTLDQRREIIDYIADGLMDGRSLRSICTDEDMPPKTTVLRWMTNAEDSEDEEERELVTIIARARDLQSEALFDDMSDICAKIESGELGANEGKAIIWAKQWQAGKLKPKKYGDKQHIEHSGKVDYSDMSDDELERKLQELRQEAERAARD